jgi:hypothetical protein
MRAGGRIFSFSTSGGIDPSEAPKDQGQNSRSNVQSPRSKVILQKDGTNVVRIACCVIRKKDRTGSGIFAERWDAEKWGVKGRGFRQENGGKNMGLPSSFCPHLFA